MAKESKRELILNALEALLPGKRFHEITLDEVSRAAGVGKGTIYLYFRDKDALFSEMVCFRMERLRSELLLLTGTASGDLPRQVLEMICEFINQHRSGFGQEGEFASQVAKMSAEELAKLKEIADSIVECVTEIMLRTEKRWSLQEARNNARLFLWIIDGYARSRISGADDLPDQEYLLGFFRKGSGMEDGI